MIQETFTAEYFLSTQTSKNFEQNLEPITVVVDCANNRFAQAVVCIRSIVKFHPNAHFIVAFADVVKNKTELLTFLPKNSEFIEIQDLEIPNFKDFAFRYNTYEFCCNMKAFSIGYGMRISKHKKLIYCDSDLLFFAPMSEALLDLEKNDILITPQLMHLPKAEIVEARNGMNILTGTYNGGFIGIRINQESMNFVKWWGERLLTGGHDAPLLGMFGDQTWLDYAPATLNHVKVCRNPGYNVSFWNIHERSLNFNNNPPTSNDQPLCCLHLSSIFFEPHKPTTREYCPPLYAKSIEPVIHGYREAIQALLKESGMPSLEEPHAYGYFKDGKLISKKHRKGYVLFSFEEHTSKNPLSMTQKEFEKTLGPLKNKKRRAKIKKEANRIFAQIKRLISL